MWHLRALAVAVVALPLVVGTGCVTQARYNGDLKIEQDNTKRVAAQLDASRRELKKTQEERDASIADLAKAKTDLTNARLELADVRKVDVKGLQARLEAAEKTVTLEKAKAKHAEDALKTEQTRAGKKEADLTKKLQEANATIKKLEGAPKPAPHPTPPPPVTPPTPPAN